MTKTICERCENHPQVRAGLCATCTEDLKVEAILEGKGRPGVVREAGDLRAMAHRARSLRAQASRATGRVQAALLECAQSWEAAHAKSTVAR